MTALERFNALSDTDKQEILNKHRELYDNWYDSVYEMFTDDMSVIGISVGDMYFSGFWSQGDGASFEGNVYDWDKFLHACGYADEVLADHAADCFRFASIRGGSRYSHSRSATYSVDLPLPLDADDRDLCPFPDDDLRAVVWSTNMSKYDSYKLEEEFTDKFIDCMDDLYDRLEKEYEDLTSDESILANLDANELLEDAIEDHLSQKEPA